MFYVVQTNEIYQFNSFHAKTKPQQFLYFDNIRKITDLLIEDCRRRETSIVTMLLRRCYYNKL